MAHSPVTPPAMFIWRHRASDIFSMAGWSARRQLEDFAAGGATDFMANIFAGEGDSETGPRTYVALKELVGKV